MLNRPILLTLAGLLATTSAYGQAPALIMPDPQTAQSQLRAQPVQSFGSQQPVGTVSPYAPPLDLGPSVQQLTPQGQPGAMAQPGYQTATPTPTLTDFDGSLKAVRSAWDDLRKTVRQVKPGVVELDWTPISILPVTVAPLAPLTILLPPTERILPETLAPGTNFLDLKIMAPNQLEIRARRFDFDATVKFRGASGALYTFWVTAVGPDYKGMGDVIAIVKGETPLAGAASPLGGRVASPTPGGNTPLTAALTAYQANQTDIPLSAALQAVIPAGTAISVPHEIYEQNTGDYEAIGPRRIVQTPDMTIFDFGPDSATRPRPTIQKIQSGVDTQTVNFYSVADQPDLVIATGKGSFTFSFNGQVVCAIQTANPRAGLAVQQ
jgi:hypothetical protein